MSSGEWKNRPKTITGHEYSGVRQSKRLKKPMKIMRKTGVLEKSNKIIRRCWCGIIHGTEYEGKFTNGFRNYSRRKKNGNKTTTNSLPISPRINSGSVWTTT